MAQVPGEVDNMEGLPASNNNNPAARWESPDRGWEREQPTAPSLFECSRIKALADEREAVQKKTFTKWVNSHLARVGCHIGDLYADLRDGFVLTRLLEVLSGEQLPRPTRGRMRIHSLENVDKALQFLKEQRVHLENVGSHDIVDGNHRLTLGLVWTIILRFQIQVIKIETEDNRETRSAKDALLLWCQMKTAGYPEVNIQNFTTSWRDGLAFNALIHRHRYRLVFGNPALPSPCLTFLRPDLVDFSKLTKSNTNYNLQRAFRTAEQHLGLARLLDPEDVNMEAPDEKSIITYVVSFYHYFSKMKALAVEGKRIGKVLDQVLEVEKIIERYEELATELLAWIRRTVGLISTQKFANSLSGVQQQLQAFMAYCTLEKPAKFQEKGNLEVLLFSIQSKLRACNRRLYVPREGCGIWDIDKAWGLLEKAEHEREAALRAELTRQEKLGLLAQRFDHKVAMRESWLNENQRLVSQDNFGYELPAVEAAMKKHEAIEADIAAYEERVQGVAELAQALATEGYYDARRVAAQRDSVLRQWALLTGLVGARRTRLEQNLALQKVFQEMVYMVDWMEEMQAQLLSQECGQHLVEAEDLLQKHGLLEGDIAAQSERVEALNAAALRFSQLQGYQPCDPQVICNRVNHVHGCLAELQEQAARRRAELEASRSLWALFQELEEAESWARDKERLLEATGGGGAGMAALRRQWLRDALAVYRMFGEVHACELWIGEKEQWLLGMRVPDSLDDVEVVQHRFESLDQEMNSLMGRVLDVNHTVQELVEGGHPSSDEVLSCQDHLNSRWNRIVELVEQRKEQASAVLLVENHVLEVAEVRAQVREKRRAVESTPRAGGALHLEEADALLARHAALKEEVDRREEDYAHIVAASEALLAADGAELGPGLALDEWLPHLELGWHKLLGLWEARREALVQAHVYQLFLRDLRQALAVLRNQELVLSGLELPGTVESVEEALKQHRDFLTTMELNQQKMHVAVQAAEGLRRQGNIYGEQAQEAVAQLLEKSQENQLRAHQWMQKLHDQLELQHFLRDCHELDGWIHEKMLMARDGTREDGHKLHKRWLRHQAFMAELAQNKEWLEKIEREGQQLMQEKPELAASVRKKLGEIRQCWAELESTTQAKARQLFEASKADQLVQSFAELDKKLLHMESQLQDVDPGGDLATVNSQLKKLQAWVQERLPLAMQMERGNGLQAVQQYIKKNQDEQSTLQLLKKHLQLEQGVENYEDSIAQLSRQCRALLELGHPDSEQISRRQSQVDRLYVALKELGAERRVGLEQQYWLYQLSRQVDELEHWIAEKEVVAGSPELGQDFEHVTVLQEKFSEFASETGTAGRERLAAVNQMVDELIECGHMAAATMAEWKDGLNEAWAELLELMGTRAQLLAASRELHKFFSDARELQGQIEEKRRRLPHLTTPPEPRPSASSVQRTLRAFEHDLQLLVSQVRQLQEGAAQLRTVYAGEHAEAIASREQEVMQGWKELLAACEDARLHVSSTADALRFHSQARDLLSWMDGISGQIGAADKPRDVSSVEVLMNYHQGLKTELEARVPELTACQELGRSLLLNKSAMADEIQAQLDKLGTRKEEVSDKWDRHWEWLQQMLEVHQFAQEAVVADAWLTAQEPLLQSRELGSSVDEVEQLIRRHEAFRKAAAAWEERFSSLRRLTTRGEAPSSVRSRVRSRGAVRANAGRQRRSGWGQHPGLSDRDCPAPRRVLEERHEPHWSFCPAPRKATLADIVEQLQEREAGPGLPAGHEGFLLRKREVDANRKSSNRSWVSLYCVLSKGELGFYKDAKGPASGGTHGGEPLLSLHKAISEVASDYKKKKHVFKLQTQDGSEFLLQAKDEEEMNGWLEAVAASVAEHAEIARWGQTLPTTSSTDEGNPKRETGDRRASGRRK
ncbi:Spectrin beta chain, brain 3 [Myotis davidii]|uniref:Spectrin beta chain, brain 3 n=1 Tax=Myotis davidii TaxID=225400 RepID=L5M5M3_MYODS|nr:Spectrin beta chain, brain 3 [Myotis davidii]